MEALIVVFIIVIIGVVIWGVNRNKQLMDEGKIIKRDISFLETAEVFTSKGADPAKISSALRTMDISGTKADWTSKNGTLFIESGYGWSAKLELIGNNEETYKYRFQFLNWKTSRGIPTNANSMNIAITAIEKAFLQIDPKTKVESTRIKTTTKSSFL